MKTLKRLSNTAAYFMPLMGFDVDKVRIAMKCASVKIMRCETKAEMNYEGVDYAYPYIIFNPFNIDIQL